MFSTWAFSQNNPTIPDDNDATNLSTMVPTIRVRQSASKKNKAYSPKNTQLNENKYHSVPAAERLRTYLIGFAIFFIVLSSITVLNETESSPVNVPDQRSLLKQGDKNSSVVSVVILTYKSTKLFSNLLSTVVSQKQDYFEIIIVDAGCLDVTQGVINKYFPKNSTIKKRMKYLAQCHNPGYAIANNEGAKMAARSSKWILFLNDDLELQGDMFIDDMLQFGNSKPKLGIVGCKLMNAAGDEIDEAGSIVWNDGSAAGFGRGRTDVNASELLYPHPVDYVSGACIMVKKRIFSDYGGFDSESFPSYYEDTDLQMHVQHELKKEVWLLPQSIANHNAHGSFGSEESTKLMQENLQVFIKKWRFVLRDKHLENPWTLSEEDHEKQFLLASDLYARDPSKPIILYIDLDLPKNTKNKELNRSYDNLIVLSNLGYRVTVVSYHDTSDEKCDINCRDDLQKYGIEVAVGSWFDLAESRSGFYDTVIISQTLTFFLTYEKLASLYRMSPFVLIYDFDKLQYPNYEAFNKLQKDGFLMPRIHNESMNASEKEFMFAKHSEIENKLIATADIILTSSQEDIQRVLSVYPNTQIHGITHTQSIERQKFASFGDRSGILFLLPFGANTDYNIDAIFFFLENIYINVLDEAHTSIPLTIAGQLIPGELRQFVKKTTKFENMVTFIQMSEDSYTSLYEKVRIVILPQLYGNGMDYQIADAFSHGVPTVMSRAAAEAFGISNENKVDCVGPDIESFKTCIIKLYDDEKEWKALQSNALTFLQKNHDHSIVERKWSDVIKLGKATYKGWYEEYRLCRLASKRHPRSRGKSGRRWEKESSGGNRKTVHCEFHNHALSRTKLEVKIPKEYCSKWRKKYASRLPTETTYVGDKAYLLLCSS